MYSTERFVTSDNLFINRTNKYLARQVRYLFDEQQLDIFANLDWIAFTIGDARRKTMGNLHFVFRVNNNIDYSILYESPYYVENYVYLDKELDKHCLVFKPPINNINHFIKGEYSKMYNDVQLDDLFEKSVLNPTTGTDCYTDIYSVLTKIPEYEQTFKNNVLKMFNTEAVNVDEYDFPPLLNEEVLFYEENKEFVKQYKNDRCS